MLVMNVPMKNQPKMRPVLRVSNPVPPSGAGSDPHCYTHRTSSASRVCEPANPVERDRRVEQRVEVQPWLDR